jgi:hypothetical protein
MSCTQEAELEQLLQQCQNPPAPSSGRQIRVNVTDAWGAKAVECGEIRTPELVKMPSKLLLFGQCRHASASAAVNTRVHGGATGGDGGGNVTASTSGRDGAGVDLAVTGLGDDMRTVRMLTAESTDMGRTWGNIAIVSAIVSDSIILPTIHRIASTRGLANVPHDTVNPEGLLQAHKRASNLPSFQF